MSGLSDGIDPGSLESKHLIRFNLQPRLNKRINRYKFSHFILWRILSELQILARESKPDEELKITSIKMKKFLLEKKTRAIQTQIIALQSQTLRKLHESRVINDFNYTTLENQLKEFYDQQGKCERIKNFPLSKKVFYNPY